MREYNQQQTNLSASRVNLHNLKQTCNHLCEYIEQSNCERFKTKVESLRKELSKVNWKDESFAEVMSQQLVVVLYLFMQANQLGELNEELDSFIPTPPKKDRA